MSNNSLNWTDFKNELKEANYLVDVQEVAKRHSLTVEEVESAIKYYSDPNRIETRANFFNGFGHKTEPYFRESEMLLGFRCDPDELQGWELEQFNS